MRRTDIEALGELCGELLAAPGVLARDLHESVARRPFDSLGVMATPVRAINDAVTGAVYSGVDGALRAVARAGAGLAAARAREDGPALASTPAGSFALGALNGLYGNHLSARGSPLGVRMGVRQLGRDVELSRQALAEAYPDATQRIAVFVHGLMGDDACWRIFPLRGRWPGRRTYGELLSEELGFTPVHVRYNTGLHISENGRALASLLEQLRSAWPAPVQEIVLIGHSMGGLVARSACHYGEAGGHRFTASVRHVFCLGSPHLGADAEKGLNMLGHALARLPEMRGLARMVNARSVGIKDLRFGACVEEDWRDCDPDEFLRDRCTEVPFLPDAHYYFIGATVAEGPVGQLLGDLLVRIPSSSGRGSGKGRRIPFEVDNGYELSGVNHFELLNHPAVYEQLRTWIVRA